MASISVWECTSVDRAPAIPLPLPYFTVPDLPATLERVQELGGSVIHPGERWAICRDSEGSPFALRGGYALGLLAVAVPGSEIGLRVTGRPLAWISKWRWQPTVRALPVFPTYPRIWPTWISSPR